MPSFIRYAADRECLILGRVKYNPQPSATA